MISVSASLGNDLPLIMKTGRGGAFIHASMENWFEGPKLIVGALTDQVPIGFTGVGRTGAKPNALLTFPVVKKKVTPFGETVATLENPIRYVPELSPGHQSVIPKGGSKQELVGKTVSRASERFVMPSELLARSE